jgi:LPPG:FO 2-phospho-L-lactate transferase
VIEAIRDCEAVLIAPSNPITSIGPILSVPGIPEALRATSAPVAAVSPIIGGAAVSGPAGELMQTQNLPVSIVGVAKAYEDFLDVLIADVRDAAEVPAVEKGGVRVKLANTIMNSDQAKEGLARAALVAVATVGTAGAP